MAIVDIAEHTSFVDIEAKYRADIGFVLSHLLKVDLQVALPDVMQLSVVAQVAAVATTSFLVKEISTVVLSDVEVKSNKTVLSVLEDFYFSTPSSDPVQETGLAQVYCVMLVLMLLFFRFSPLLFDEYVLLYVFALVLLDFSRTLDSILLCQILRLHCLPLL